MVPADPSSAAFPLVAALIVPGSEIVHRRRDDQSAAHRPVHDAARDGRAIERLDPRSDGGEEVARSPRALCAAAGVEVPAARAPSMIDEYPVLAVAAAFAEGTTIMRGLKELRVKESDRLGATAAMLRGNGVEVEIVGDDLIVRGPRPVAGRRPRRHPHGSSHRHVGAGDGARRRRAGARSTTAPSSPPAFPASST